MKAHVLIFFGLSLVSAIVTVYIYIKSFDIQELLLLIFALCSVGFYLLGRRAMNKDKK